MPTEVVVGRIGRPHGVAGEVSVERAHRRARAAASPPAPVLRTEPAGGPPARLPVADRARHPLAQGRLLVPSPRSRDRTAAEAAARRSLLVADVDADEAPEDPEEFYDHQLVGLAVVHDRRRARRARSPTCCTAPARTCSSSRRRTAARRWCRS